MSDYVQQDFVSQILKYFPVKSLLRCRCVCKWWRQVIDSPNFTQEHLALQSPRIMIGRDEPEFFVVEPGTLRLMDTLSVPIEDNNEQFDLIGTLHGVVCLFDNDGGVWLWNPSIRKASSLPLPQFRFFNFLGFYYERRFWYSGFWIDPSTKDFKVVVFKLSAPCLNPTLYSSVQKAWKTTPLSGYFGSPGGPAIVIGKVAYWEAHRAPTGDKENELMEVVVLSFDFVLETFDHFEAPRLRDGRITCLILEKWQDTISFAYLDRLNNDCNIYLRREGSWVHMFCLTMGLSDDIWNVICVMGGTEERENIRPLATTERDLIFHDSNAGWMVVKSRIENPYDIYVAYDFVESLLFPEEKSIDVDILD